MGVYVQETEVVCAVSAEKMFKAIALDYDVVLPKVLPHDFKSIETVEGDGGVGTIKKINFGEGEKFDYAMQKTDVLDKHKLEYHYTWFEGDALLGIFEKLSHEMKFEEKHGGGSVCKLKTKFFFIGDVHAEEDKLKIVENKVIGLFKAVEGHCLGN